MIKHLPITPTKTYATEQNAHKAIVKKLPWTMEPTSRVQLRYFIMPYRKEGETDYRFFPVFFGQSALDARIFHHFNVVA